MPDDNPDPPEPTSEPSPKAVEVSTINLEEWERYKAQLRRELEQHKDEAGRQVNELREALKEATDFIAELKAGISAREEAKVDSTTFVVPPEQLSLPQTQSEAMNPESNPENTQRRSGWKKWI